MTHSRDVARRIEGAKAAAVATERSAAIAHIKAKAGKLSGEEALVLQVVAGELRAGLHRGDEG